MMDVSSHTEHTWTSDERQIWIINGFPRSGKDTFCSEFIARWNMMTRSPVENQSRLLATTVSSIDPIFQLLTDAGIPMARNALTDNERCLLAEVGRSLEDRADFRTLRMVDACREFFSPTNKPDRALSGRIIFVHMREPDLIDKFKVTVEQEMKSVDRSHGLTTTIKTILVRRPDENKTVQNDADQAVLNYAYDTTILNSGTVEDLQNFVRQFVHYAYGRALLSQYTTIQ